MWTQKSFSSKKTPIFCPNGSSIHKVYFSKTSVNKCLTYDFRKNALLEWKLNFNQFEQFFKIFSPKNSPIYRKIRRNKSFNQKSVSFPKMTNDFRKNYFRGKMQFGPYNFSKNYWVFERTYDSNFVMECYGKVPFLRCYNLQKDSDLFNWF